MSTLTKEEHSQVVKVLGREPNEVELGVFSVMWSEHCCYKSSKIHLKQFPTKSPRVLQGPGENAGILDIGDGLAIAFKIESHNHPSFIEPYQGAATGVGGILRDIFTMGARPIANLNSLHFGAIDHPRTPYLVRGVVAGVGGYGNCMGIATVGGETRFEECYNGNILVNAFTLGVMNKNKIFLGLAAGVGNPVILVGSKTGRDGIHGATMASDVFGSESESKRPTVQVGDPFTEKKLMEACLEAFQCEGAIVGIQDMGAAGFTCSTFEMSARGDVGMTLLLDKIPLREKGMTPYEIMLSESQERMLLVAKKGREEELRKIFQKWELEFQIVGEVIAEKRVRGFYRQGPALLDREAKSSDFAEYNDNEKVFDLPVAPVTDSAPLYDRPAKKPPLRRKVPGGDKEGEGEVELCPTPPSPYKGEGDLLQLLSSPNLASKNWVWRQYDHMVGTNTVVKPGCDAAVLRIKENGKQVAMKADGKARWCYLDPYWGAVHTLAEGVRNLACVGATPVGITDCLNFGNPENPEIMWQFKEVCRGLADACNAFETPVVGGNVSLYNESEGKNIYPTPIVAIVGLLEKDEEPQTLYWKKEGDLIYWIGETASSLAGSEYLKVVHKKVAGTLTKIDFAKELTLQKFCLEAIHKKIIASAHDVSDGGLAVTLAECSFLPDGNVLGAKVTLEETTRPDVLLFGEGSQSIVVSLDPSKEKEFLELAKKINCPVKKIGKTGGEKLVINQWIDADLKLLHEKWSSFVIASFAVQSPLDTIGDCRGPFGTSQ